MNIPNGINSTTPVTTDKSQADPLASTGLSANPLNLAKVVKPAPEGSTTRAISEYLKSIQSAAAVAPPFDANKVASLQNDLASGEYKVDSGKVADSLISAMSGMLSPAK
ncbi:MAG: flagellar biosynthesis anti-sigma factor FlgM [Alcaligenaceae bacterium]